MQRLQSFGVGIVQSCGKRDGPARKRARSRVRRAEIRPGNGVALLRRSARGGESAALRLDTDTVLRSLQAGLRSDGVLPTWHRLCRPVLMRIGRRVADRGDCIDVELMLSWAIITSLHRTHEAATAAEGEPVLLACTAGEQHSLGLEVLRAALAEQRIGARMLGASVPTTALVDAVGRTRPAAVVLSSQVPRTASVAALRKTRRAAGCVIAAGPGWAPHGVPPDIVHGGTIEQVLSIARTAVGSTAAAG